VCVKPFVIGDAVKSMGMLRAHHVLKQKSDNPSNCRGDLRHTKSERQLRENMHKYVQKLSVMRSLFTNDGHTHFVTSDTHLRAMVGLSTSINKKTRIEQGCATPSPQPPNGLQYPSTSSVSGALPAASEYNPVYSAIPAVSRDAGTYPTAHEEEAESNPVGKGKDTTTQPQTPWTEAVVQAESLKHKKERLAQVCASGVTIGVLVRTGARLLARSKLVYHGDTRGITTCGTFGALAVFATCVSTRAGALWRDYDATLHNTFTTHGQDYDAAIFFPCLSDKLK
jgi:hypothetical protein